MRDIDDHPGIYLMGILSTIVAFKAMGAMMDTLTAIATHRAVIDNADLIVDSSVSAQALREKGYYIKNDGFLAECRKSVLTGAFNEKLSNLEKASKVNDCIYAAEQPRNKVG